MNNEIQFILYHLPDEEGKVQVVVELSDSNTISTNVQNERNKNDEKTTMKKDGIKEYINK